MRTDAQRAAVKRYSQTAKGKAARKRHIESDKCKATAKRWAKSKVGRASNKRRFKKYYATTNGYLRNIFSSILNRCNNPKERMYYRYGGRGIKMYFTSDEFVNYVINELQIDPRGLDCDRIDNDGHYERGNIRFVTHKENCQNR